MSFLLFGALGGLLYILRMHTKGYALRPVDFIARPVFGAISAFIITVSLGLPNHGTSLFVGYFGIDVWDALSRRAELQLGSKLPLAQPHVPEGAEVTHEEADVLLDEGAVPMPEGVLGVHESPDESEHPPRG